MSKSIFITGGAQGIGKSIARLFISKGWRVGILDLDQDRLTKTATEFGVKISTFYGSVNEDEDVEKALESFTSPSQRELTVLVNNAGIIHTGEFDNMDFKANQSIIEINVIGLMRVTKHALPYLKPAKKSKIINMASISSITGIPTVAAYAASKSAVKSLTESFYVAFKKYGVDVCSVIPHLVNTKMVAENVEAFGLKSSSESKSTPDQVAQAVWNAYKGNRIHNLVSLDARLLYRLSKIIPTKWLLNLVKKIIKYN